MTEGHLDDLRLSQLGGIVEDGVLGRSTGTLSHLLGDQVEVPVFLTDSILADHSTGKRIEESFLVLGEETFTDSLLHDDLHEFGIVHEITFTDVLETVQDLFNFIF